MLNKIANKWRQRAFNIESLTVGPSEVAGLSRMTFTVDGAAHDIEQVTKQLYKVIEVVKITDVTERATVARELALMKVATTKENRSAIIEIVDVFRAKIVDVGTDSVVIEAQARKTRSTRSSGMLTPYG